MTQPAEWISTGAAAELLGTTRQHVVDLCKRGELPFIMVGSHRRVRREDVDWLRASGARLTADQRRSLRLGHALAGKIVLDPDRARELGRHNLAQLRAAHPRGKAQKWFGRWEELLKGPLDEILTVLTSSAVPVYRELRQNHPFAGLLTDEERQQLLSGARRR